MRFSTAPFFFFSLALSALAAPIPGADELEHALFARAQPPLSGPPSVGDVIGIQPSKLNGQIPAPTGGKISSLLHPAIVLSDADAKGRFTIAVVSHTQNISPVTPVTSLLNSADLGKVITSSAKNGASPLEGTATNPTFAFTGSKVTTQLTNMKVFPLEAGSASSVGTDSVNGFLTALKLPTIAADDAATAADDAATDASTSAADASSGGIVSDAENAVKGAAGDAADAVEGAVKGASGSLGEDAATAAEDVGKGLLEHLRV